MQSVSTSLAALAPVDARRDIAISTALSLFGIGMKHVHERYKTVYNSRHLFKKSTLLDNVFAEVSPRAASLNPNRLFWETALLNLACHTSTIAAYFFTRNLSVLSQLDKIANIALPALNWTSSLPPLPALLSTQVILLSLAGAKTLHFLLSSCNLLGQVTGSAIDKFLKIDFITNALLNVRLSLLCIGMSEAPLVSLALAAILCIHNLDLFNFLPFAQPLIQLSLPAKQFGSLNLDIPALLCLAVNFQSFFEERSLARNNAENFQSLFSKLENLKKIGEQGLYTIAAEKITDSIATDIASLELSPFQIRLVEKALFDLRLKFLDKEDFKNTLAIDSLRKLFPEFTPMFWSTLEQTQTLHPVSDPSIFAETCIRIARRSKTLPTEQKAFIKKYLKYQIQKLILPPPSTN